MLGLKLNHVSKRGHWRRWVEGLALKVIFIYCVCQWRYSTRRLFINRIHAVLWLAFFQCANTVRPYDPANIWGITQPFVNYTALSLLTSTLWISNCFPVSCSLPILTSLPLLWLLLTDLSGTQLTASLLAHNSDLEKIFVVLLLCLKIQSCYSYGCVMAAELMTWFDIFFSCRNHTYLRDLG